MLQGVDLPRRQVGKITEVEEHGMLLEHRFDVKGRIASFARSTSTFASMTLNPGVAELTADRCY